VLFKVHQKFIGSYIMAVKEAMLV